MASAKGIWRRRTSGIRITDRSFLAQSSAMMAELFHYWDRMREDRPMPRRYDISPDDFPLHLSRVLLVDVKGLSASGLGIYRYRVVGTKEVSVRGYDPTGKSVREAAPSASREDAFTCYEVVRQQRTFLYEPHEYTTPEGNWEQGVSLFLPLSEDGEAVSQILVFSEPRKWRSETRQLASGL